MTDWDAETTAAYLDEPQVGGNRAPETAPAVPPLHVAVVGSTEWDDPLVVQAALLSWYRHHTDRPIILWTTGAPTGAENDAREHAERSNWTVIETDPDRILEQEFTVVFGFVTPGSDAAEFARDLAVRKPVRLFTVESLRPRSRWSQW